MVLEFRKVLKPYLPMPFIYNLERFYSPSNPNPSNNNNPLGHALKVNTRTSIDQSTSHVNTSLFLQQLGEFG